MRTTALLVLLALTACVDADAPSAPGGALAQSLVVDTGAVDWDLDGFPAGTDCDDFDSQTYPGADETCDGKDNDCDTIVDEDAIDAPTYFRDADDDGYGDGLDTRQLCDAEPGWVSNQDDCDDTDAATFPGAGETCNGVDDDCDMEVDEDAFDAVPVFRDADGDDRGDPTTLKQVCTAEPGWVGNDADCDDGDPTRYTGAPEIVGDEVDQDCDGGERCYTDGDDDGVRTTEVLVSLDADCADEHEAAAAATDGDCDDADAAVYPGATEVVADGVDQDCDGGDLCWADADDDGYRPNGTATRTSDDLDCVDAGEAAATDPTGDCDDARADVSPGDAEVCDPNDLDEDCDGLADDADASAGGRTTMWTDGDGDGFGGAEVLRCDFAVGITNRGGDCADADPAINPFAEEVVDDGVDQNCDSMELCFVDQDGDGFRKPDGGTIGSDDLDCDDDFEGHAAEPATDCDDTRATINPNGTEVCDGRDRDEDCDGAADDADPSATGKSTYHLDADADGWGGPTTTSVCDPGPELVADGTDCDDADDAVHPFATEICDAADVDEDCDGAADDDDADVVGQGTFYADADADGFGGDVAVQACSAPAGSVVATGDCDDADDRFFPGATETCSDPNDYNCDGSVGFDDADHDGVAACDDCDDDEATAYPGADEVCDGDDDDCDGEVDEDATDAATWYADADADGYGDPTTSVDACAAPSGYVADAQDCDDASDAAFPGAPETCLDLDDLNCDGSVGFADADGDGTPACEDCDDRAEDVFPGADEVCNGVDDDCDGDVDGDAIDTLEFFADLDDDGYGDPASSVVACTPPVNHVEDATDCDDGDERFHPGAAETCTDPLDYDCDGQVTYGDADADGVADCLDCNDADPDAYPGATEVCDGVDNDCNGTVDQGAVGATVWYVDADDDGFADLGRPFTACTAPAGYIAATADDCDDQDDTVFPDAAEIRCDGLDQDCDGEDELDENDCLPVDTDEPVDTEQPGDTDAPVDTEVPVDTEQPGDTEVEDTGGDGTDEGGCSGVGCDSRGPGAGLGLLPLVALLALRRRR